MFLLRARFYFLLLLTVAASHDVLAQDAGPNQAQAQGEYGIFVADLLPTKINGVSEIMPFTGLIYSTPVGSNMLETSLGISNSSGSTYDLLEADYRYDVPLDNKLEGYLKAGVLANYFSTSERSEQIIILGAAVGCGVGIRAVGPVWVRTGLQFNVSPGFSMMISLSFLYRDFAGGGGAGP